MKAISVADPIGEVSQKKELISFSTQLQNRNVSLMRDTVTTLQVNIGKLCNQACLHCHVEAGPLRKENMVPETVEQCLEFVRKNHSVNTIDITGGAPEMNPSFRYFVQELRKMGKQVIDRCNLTVFTEPNQEDTAEFLAANQVHVVASLPCYSKERVEKQRGRGVFGKSIAALQKLNSLGYGKEGTGLILDLVYNPGGASLPPAQAALQVTYKAELKQLFDIEFNHLFTITNMPIKRFLYDLEKQGRLSDYMQLLVNNFNVSAAEVIMCKSLVSVSWDGYLYDCDFNQMLDMPIGWKKTHISEVTNLSDLKKIAYKNHCYGCTAGTGSSCTGALALS